MRKTVFLDTTIVGERFCGRPHHQIEIEELLDSSAAVATGYVADQFRATFLAGAVLLYNRIQDRAEEGRGGEPRPWREIEADILLDLDDWAYAQPREGGRARKLLARLIRTTTEAGELRRTLTRWIEVELTTVASDHIALEDATRCQRTLRSATLRDGLYFIEVSCNLQQHKDCVIEAFWNARPHLLQAVADLPPQSVADVDAARRVALEVIRDGELPRGRRCWVSLSDAVIAAEATANSHIATTNMKDFEPLAGAMAEGRVAFNPLSKLPTKV